MLKNNPVRLHKKAIVYDKPTVYLTGTLFIMALVIVAFIIGSESLNYLLWSCI